MLIETFVAPVVLGVFADAGCLPFEGVAGAADSGVDCAVVL